MTIRKKSKYKLVKKVVTGTVSITLASIVGLYAYHSWKNDVLLPEDYNTIGKTYSVSTKNDDVCFFMVGIDSWNKGIDEGAIKKVNACKSMNIPCGLELNSIAKSQIQILADATSLMANIENIDIDYPLFLNIDLIAENLNDESLIGILQTFVNFFNDYNKRNLGTKYFIGLSGNEENLAKLVDNFSDITKLVKFSDRVPDGEFNIAYSQKTKTYYTDTNYKSIIESGGFNNNEKRYLKGIDVSQAQGDINWDELVNDINPDFVIIKLCTSEFLENRGYQNYVDNFFDNLKGCQDYNIPYGIYQFTGAYFAYTNAKEKGLSEDEAYAYTIEHVKKEAQLVIEKLNTLKENNNLNLSLPVYYDIEDPQDANGNVIHFYTVKPNLSAQLSATFISELEKAGYKSAIYASLSLMRQIMNSSKKLNLNLDTKENWAAYYSKYGQKFNYSEVNPDMIYNDEDTQYSIIQVTSEATVNGTKSLVDVNYIINPTVLEKNKKVIG